jgi:hypothetical protein
VAQLARGRMRSQAEDRMWLFCRRGLGAAEPWMAIFDWRRDGRFVVSTRGHGLVSSTAAGLADADLIQSGKRAVPECIHLLWSPSLHSRVHRLLPSRISAGL